MLDLHEAMRGLRFAPEALAVLDANRQVRVISRQAERLFGVPAADLVGRTTSHVWAEESRPAFMLALNEAAQRIGHADTAAPVIRRLKTSKAAMLDMCVSAWHPTDDPMYATSKSPTNTLTAPRTIMIHECFYTISLRDVNTPRRNNRLGRKTEAKTHLEPPTLHPVDEGVDLASPLTNSSDPSRPPSPRMPQNVMYEDSHTSFLAQGFPMRAPLDDPIPTPLSSFGSAALSPPRRPSIPTLASRSSPSPPPITLAETLRDGVIDALGVPTIALSADGTVAIRNQRWVELVGAGEPGVVLFDGSAKHGSRCNSPSSGLRPSPGSASGLNATRQWHPSLVLTDLDFTSPIGPNSHPLYRAAVLGQVVNEHRCGGVRTDEASFVSEKGDTNGSGGGSVSSGSGDSPTRTERSDAGSDPTTTVKAASPSGTFRPLLSDSYFPQGAKPTLERAGSDSVVGETPSTVRQAPSSVLHDVGIPDGVRLVLEISARPVRDTRGELVGGVMTIRDVTQIEKERVQSVQDESNSRTCTDIHDTVEALAVSRRAQERLQATLNHAAVTLWAIDQDMKITIAEGPGLRQLKLMNSPQGSTTTSSSRSDHSSSQPPSSHTNSRSAHRTRNNSMIGRSIYEAWDASLIGSAIERAFAGENAVQEMEIEGRWFRTQFTPLREEWEGLADGVGIGPAAVVASSGPGGAADEERPVIGVVGASMDITDRKIAEVRLRESFAERSRLLASETAAKEASRLKSQFLANMSHEIRTPIAGVIGLSELLCDTHLNEEQRGIAENIQRSADALLTVINDILDFSKVEIGKLDIDNIPLSLGVVLLDTKKMLSFAARKKGLIFNDEIHIKYAGRVMGDPGRLRQVLTNLLTNSIKFTSEGSITLRAIQESEDEKTVRVRFSVEDEGMGIADSIRERLFQPFSQADSSTARRYGGTGLGLTISKNLVELMRGRIGLDSKEGKGTCAWFSVPFKKASDELPAAPRSNSNRVELDKPTSTRSGKRHFIAGDTNGNGLLGSNMVNGMAPRPSGSLQRPREGIWILVAEDNLINQQIALKTLRKMNFNAEAADNGKQVLAALERRTYDLILMDCQMPEMDGYEATMCIRQLESVEVRSIPIIAMTASAIRGDKEKCLKVGMSDYLSKPVKRQALEAMLVRWLYDETYRQELSRWFLPPQKALSMSPTSTPTLEAGTPTSVRPELFQVPDSIKSLGERSLAADITTKAGMNMNGHIVPNRPIRNEAL
ncbi:protein-histidine kinase [Rhizoctonia solani]|uniref:Protein-histidine kinase n=1 Tax=Rhizoctonia solani TaxID=456999 RepID=A0A8H8T282_9AGAM|nr:protein-histidine kinase [Rhizoctonia solani]QRW26609.1 protein-histidine kinase [Rhizoctonia solani]